MCRIVIPHQIRRTDLFKYQSVCQHTAGAKKSSFNATPVYSNNELGVGHYGKSDGNWINKALIATRMIRFFNHLDVRCSIGIGVYYVVSKN